MNVSDQSFDLLQSALSSYCDILLHLSDTLPISIVQFLSTPSLNDQDDYGHAGFSKDLLLSLLELGLHGRADGVWNLDE